MSSKPPISSEQLAIDSEMDSLVSTAVQQKAKEKQILVGIFPQDALFMSDYGMAAATSGQRDKATIDISIRITSWKTTQTAS